MTANAGYHAYATGDVLTAAQVQYNLQNQTVMYFATASARTTALTGVVVEGMVTYIPANGLEYYNGSAWVTLSTGGDITDVLAGKGLTGGGTSGSVTLALGTTAKGDLVAGTGTTTAAALTVGADGTTLVADSSTSTGLRYGANFAAGKNKIINGDFGIWQRGTSFSNGSGVTYQYCADRWASSLFYGANTVSRQTFTPGTAPVAGYEGKFFYRGTLVGSSGANNVEQRIEDVQTFAGQTMTISFWAKADASRALNVVPYQFFGSGGSAIVSPTSQSGTVTTSWTRYSFTFAMPSISGKTIGTSSYLGVIIGLDPIGSANSIFDLWGVQAEQGSVATAFQTATGTIQGELAACQRYYTRWTSADSYSVYGLGNAYTTAAVQMVCFNPVPMRVEPTAVDFSTLAVFDGSTVIGITTCILYNSGNQALTVTLGGNTFTAFRPYSLISNNSLAGYIGFSAEL